MHFPAPSGWIADVCDGAPQRACTPQLFTNESDLNYNLSIVEATDFINTNIPFKLYFPKPFLPIAVYSAAASQTMTNNAATNSAIWPILPPALQPPAIQAQYIDVLCKMFQNMQETTVNNEPTVQMGLSYDESVAYNKPLSGQNFNYYFNNYTKMPGNAENLNSLMNPMKLIRAFWVTMDGFALDIEQVVAQELPNFVATLIAQSNRKFWGVPGVYTIDPTNAAQWVQDTDGLRDCMSNAWGDEAPKIYIIQQTTN
jgi:hypothetical protein